MMIIYLLIVFCFLMLFLSIYTLRRLDKHFIKIVDEGIYYVDTNNRVYSIAYDNAINEISEFLIENNDSLPNILIIHHIGDTPIASYMADYYKTRGIDIRLEIVSSSFDVIKYKLLAESVSNSDHVLLILSEQSCNSTKFLEIASYVQMYGRNKGNKRFVICMKIYNGTCPDLAGNIVVQGYRLICLKELFVSSIEVFRKLFSTKPVELIQAMIENGNANYQKAYELGQAALLKRKYIAESYFQLGISYSYLGQYEKAYVSYQKAALLKNDLNDSCQNNINHNWAKCFNTGVFCLNYNDTNNALQYFRDSTCANPMMIKGWINLGYLYYKLDNDNPSYKEELSSVIDKLLLLVDDNAEDRVITLEFIFQVLIDKDDNERVQKVFERYWNDKKEIVEFIGYQYLSKNKWEYAIKYISLALSKYSWEDTDRFNQYYNIGICNHKLNHYKEAADAFQKALLINPDDKNAQYSLLLAYYSGELLDDTIAQGTIYTDKYPEDPRGWQILGLSYRQKGFSEKAEVAISKYEELNKPDDIK